MSEGSEWSRQHRGAQACRADTDSLYERAIAIVVYCRERGRGALLGVGLGALDELAGSKGVGGLALVGRRHGDDGDGDGSGGYWRTIAGAGKDDCDGGHGAIRSSSGGKKLDANSGVSFVAAGPEMQMR